MRYLVTGGAGFIGSTLCRKLLSTGHSVVCLDDLSTGSLSNIEGLLQDNNFTFVNHDLTKPYFTDDIDAIFNLACPASPVHYQYNPIRTLKMGTLAMYNVLGLATRLKIPILQASTSEIYGDPLVHPQTEDYWGNVNPIGPRACYDEGKRVAESLCMAYKDYNNTSIRIVRIFNTYGPFMGINDGRVISNFAVQALKKQSLTVYGDGSQTRSFCYVDDLVDGIIKLMSSEYMLPVNIGNPDEFTIIELVNLIGEKLGHELSVTHKNLPTDDPQRRRPDISKAEEILSWKPKVKLKDGLTSTLDWFAEQLLQEEEK